VETALNGFPDGRQVVVLEFAFFDKGGISKPFSLEVLGLLQTIQRADERTRTADLLQLRVIHQALQGFA
jgi:hypothetical protein